MIRRLLALAVLLFALPLAAAERLVFESPDAPAIDTGRLLDAPFAPAGETVGFVTRHPLMQRVDMQVLALPDGRRFYAPVNADGTDLEIADPAPWVPPMFRIMAVMLAVAAAAWFFAWRRKRLSPTENLWLALAVLVLFRVVAMLWSLMICGDYFCAPSDDLGYLEVSRGIMRGNFSGPWSFTVGLSVLYLPFMLIFGESYFAFAPALSTFSALVLSPLALALAFLFMRRICGSMVRAWWAGAVLAAWPFFVHWIQRSSGPVDWMLSAPRLGADFFNYNIFIGAGYNTMSDTFAMLAVFAALLMAATVPLKWYWSLAAGAVFGFACLIRVNDVFYLPVMALVWMLREERPWSGIALARYAAGGLMAMAVFSVQLAVNHHQLGGIFTFPYVLHPNRAAAGFLFECIPGNLAFLFNANRPWWAAGLAALALVSDRKSRTIIALWSLPVLLFFCGYPCATWDAARFLLPIYGAFILAAALLCWKRQWWLWGALSVAVYFSGPWAAGAAALLLLLRALADAAFLLKPSRSAGDPGEAR